jgi:hypothetical protein
MRGGRNVLRARHRLLSGEVLAWQLLHLNLGGSMEDRSSMHNNNNQDNKRFFSRSFT